VTEHAGVDLRHCPVCRDLPPVPERGLQFAARVLAHGAVSEEDVDLALVAEYVAGAHGPGDRGLCVGCGEPFGYDPKLGLLLPCSEWSSIRTEVNRVVMDRAAVVAARVKGVSRG
jgi:hypothetical protein